MTSPTAIALVAGDYPSAFPFAPSVAYPELRTPVGAEPNPVYDAVRESLRLLGLDRERFGRRDWNPLGEIIGPGDRVFLKPNLVTHEYRRACAPDGDLFSVITHPAVVRAVADYAAIALDGRGELIIGDNPSIDADFGELMAATELDRFAALYTETFGIACRVVDLRPRRTVDLADYGTQSRTVEQAGDPDGEVRVDLGRRSYFRDQNPRLLRGVFSDRRETIRSHSGGRHEYAVSASIFDADVYISVPKLKAHHKVGTTLNIKGLVGICSNKNLLPHWKVGFPAFGGDELPPAHRRRDNLIMLARTLVSDAMPERFRPQLERRFRGSLLERLTRVEQRHGFERFRGAWDGNDTCWRMAADLYNLFVRDVAGAWRRPGRERRFFSVVDGVRGGEGDGPFCPRAKQAHTIIAGRDLLAVDLVASRLMDFRIGAIPYLRHLVEEWSVRPEDIPIVSSDYRTDEFFAESNRYLDFIPPGGWRELSLHREGGPTHALDRPCGGSRRAAHAAHAQHAEAAPGPR